MALEETGVRLVVMGEAAFNSAMQKAMAVSVALGQAIYDAALAAGQAMVNFATESVDAASSLNESINAVGVVFGSGAQKILDFGKTAATTVGLSNNAFNQMATTTGALLQNVGFSADRAGNETIKLTQRASDMASVFNTDVADAMAAIQSGLKGEADPLERFGVKLNAAQIEAKALAMGLKKTTKALTDSDKAAAALELIYAQTAKTQGDFANTSKGFANAQRIFNSTLEDTKAKLGTAVLPILGKVMEAINKMFSNPKFQAGLDAFINGITKVGDFLGVLLDDITSGDFGLAFDDFREGLYGLFPPEMEGIITTFNQALGTVWETVEKIGIFIGGVVTYIQEQGITTFGDFFYALANGFLSISEGTGILQGIGDVLFVVGDIVNQVMTWIQTTIQTALVAIQGWWNENGTAVIATVTKLWASVSGMFQSAVTFISTLISWLVTNIQAFWTSHGEEIMRIVGALWAWLQTAFQVATGTISLLFQAFTKLLQGDWQGFTDKLLEAWDMLWGFIKQSAEIAWAGISKWFEGIVKAIVEFFTKTDWKQVGTDILNGIWNGLQAGWAWLIKQVEALAQSLLDAALSALNNGKKSKSGGGVVNPNQPQGMQSFGAGQSVGMIGGLASMAAGPVTNTYNYANNYNLNLTTTQTTQSVRTSFAIMQMLAG